jgi:hypothetical protein
MAGTYALKKTSQLKKGTKIKKRNTGEAYTIEKGIQ